MRKIVCVLSKKHTKYRKNVIELILVILAI